MQEVRSNISCALINVTTSPYSYYPEAMLTDRPVQVSGTVKGRGITYCRTADRSQVRNPTIQLPFCIIGLWIN